MSEKPFETVNVTIPVPKAVVELFKALSQVRKDTGVESLVLDRVMWGLESEIKELTEEGLLGVDGEQLLKAYGLGWVFQPNNGDAEEDKYVVSRTPCETIEVKPGKKFLDRIRRHPQFKYYTSMEDFIIDSMRHMVEWLEKGLL